MVNSRKINLLCAILFITACFSCLNIVYSQESSSSQKMIGLLPDDVLFFAITSGCDVLKGDFEKTILGRICNDPNVKTFYQSVQQSILQKIQKESDSNEVSVMFNMGKSIAEIISSRPVIIGVAQKAAKEGPPVYGFAILDAGQRKSQITGLLSNFEAMAGEGEIVDVNIGSYTFHCPKDNADVPGYWGWVGNYLVFAINDVDGLAIKHLQGSTNRQIPNYIERPSGTNDLFAVYINAGKGLNLLKTIAKSEGKEDKYALIETVLGQLGIDKIKTITSRSGFDGSGIAVDELIEIPQPHTGLFADLNTISLDALNMVSANAISISVVNCDIAGIYDTVMNAIKSVAGNDFNDIEMGIAELEKQTGVKIRKGLLESLNGQMVTYSLSGGTSLQSLQGGFVIIAGLKNAQLWQDSIAAIGKFAVEKSNGTIQASSQEQNGRTLNTIAITPLAIAQIMPTWTIVGENVVIGSNPTICTTAADLITPGGKPVTIRSSESFRNATANLPSNLISFQYTDSKVQLTQMMAVLQQLWPIATMYVAQQGITLPLILPNLSDIIKDVPPSIQYSYFDQKGLHSHYKGASIEPSIGAVAGAAAGLGVMMPALARTRQIAFRMVTGTNLSVIGKAMLIYANDNDDEFPPNLEESAKKMDIEQKTLESKRKPANFNGLSFIYIPGQTTSDEPGNILVYENPEFCSDGVNVLFVDSHVEFVKKEDFIRELKATYERLKRPMPDVKFKE